MLCYSICQRKVDSVLRRNSLSTVSSVSNIPVQNASLETLVIPMSHSRQKKVTAYLTS